MTFLVASPCEFTRELLLYALSAYGAEDIHESVDGAHAARLLREKNIQVLLADLRMAPIDGPTLTRLVRCEETSLPQPAVVVLLADDPTVEEVLEARDAGIDDLIRFPFSAETLHRRVHRCLSRWRHLSSSWICDSRLPPRRREPRAPVWPRLDARKGCQPAVPQYRETDR